MNIGFMGDSNTDYGYGSTATWSYRLALRLMGVPVVAGYAGGSSYSGSGRVFYNDALSGRHTDEMLAAFDALVARLAAGDYCFILGPTNDVAHGYDIEAVTKPNIIAMVNKCLAAGVTPILSTIPPRAASNATVLRAFNAWERTYCATNGIRCEDVYARVDPTDTNVLSPTLSADGTHFNAVGGQFVADGIDASAFSPTLYRIAPFGPAADYTVRRDGSLRDGVAGLAATITGNGGVLPNVRPWSSLIAGARGWCADFTTAVAVTILTAALRAEAGTMVAVCGPSAQTGTARKVVWRADGNNRLTLHTLAPGNGSTASFGAVVAGVAANANGSAVVGPHVAAGSWANGAKVKSYHNGVETVSADANYSTLSLPATATIGSQSDGTGHYTGSMHRFVFYDRDLSAEEKAALNALLNGPATISPSALLFANTI